MSVHEATHISRPRIYLGLKEIKSKEKLNIRCFLSYQKTGGESL
jgi:hypothetical protein